MNTLKLTFIGYDTFNRPVYRNGKHLFCDVDPLSRCEPNICTKYGGFSGEPDTEISHKFVLEFIPKRMVWR